MIMRMMRKCGLKSVGIKHVLVIIAFTVVLSIVYVNVRLIPQYYRQAIYYKDTVHKNNQSDYIFQTLPNSIQDNNRSDYLFQTLSNTLQDNNHSVEQYQTLTSTLQDNSQSIDPYQTLPNTLQDNSHSVEPYQTLTSTLQDNSQSVEPYQTLPNTIQDNSHLVDLYQNLPSITLYVRMSVSVSKLRKELFCELLRTATLYWTPRIGPLLFVLNEESKMDHNLSQTLPKFQSQLKLKIDVKFERLPKNMTILTRYPYRSVGYKQQLYSSFFIDQFVDTLVVAWTDTDGRFTSPVTPETIIKNGRLVVKGMNTFHNPWMSDWDSTTKYLIGKQMPSDFMTYFPVYMWKDTIKRCRDYILKYLNVTNLADALLQKESTYHGHNFVSPVNVFLTYAFYFERERYDWHIDISNEHVTMNLTAYNAQRLEKGHELRLQDTTPDVHVSVHGWRYKGKTFNDFLSTYCAVANFTSFQLRDDMTSKCDEYKHVYPMTLFEFCNVGVTQGHLKSWCKNISVCHQVIRRHYNNVQKVIETGVYDLDLKRVRFVEKLALDYDVKCPALF